jgi:hypothetical protein
LRHKQHVAGFEFDILLKVPRRQHGFDIQDVALYNPIGDLAEQYYMGMLGLIVEASSRPLEVTGLG